MSQDHPLYGLMRKEGYSEKTIEILKAECHIKARSCGPKLVEELLFYEKKMTNLIHSLFLTGTIEIRERHMSH